MVSTTSMAFGAYAGVAMVTNATIFCTSSTPYTLGVNAGPGKKLTALLTICCMMVLVSGHGTAANDARLGLRVKQ